MSRTTYVALVGIVFITSLTLYFVVRERPSESDSDWDSRAVASSNVSAENELAREEDIAVPIDETVANAVADALRTRRNEQPPLLPSAARPLEVWNARGIPGPFLAQAESAFSDEIVDPRWSSGKEADILRGMTEMTGISLTEIQVECRTTMCRLQLQRVSLCAP